MQHWVAEEKLQVYTLKMFIETREHHDLTAKVMAGNTETPAHFRRKSLSIIVTIEELKEGPCKQLCAAKHSAHQGDCRGARLNQLMSYIGKWVWSGRTHVLSWTLPPLGSVP